MQMQEVQLVKLVHADIKNKLIYLLVLRYVQHVCANNEEKVYFTECNNYMTKY